MALRADSLVPPGGQPCLTPDSAYLPLMDPALVAHSVTTLLRELVQGGDPKECWVLNPDDPGLLASLDRLSAQAASTPAPAGGASIAAHVDHLIYGLDLLNRWARGEENPFGAADWTLSWQRGTVTDAEWDARRQALRSELDAWKGLSDHPRELSQFELTGLLGSVVHLAYHLGAIRQIDRAAQGPPARR